MGAATTHPLLPHPGGPAGPNLRHRAKLPGVPVATVLIPGLGVAGTMGGNITSQTWGPSAAWRPSRDPRSVTPTCGHAYTRSGTVTLTAVVTWDVGWQGGGQSATVPDLTTTASVTVRVVQAPALNTTRSG